jgi:hypothetical protein
MPSMRIHSSISAAPFPFTGESTFIVTQRVTMDGKLRLT